MRHKAVFFDVGNTLLYPHPSVEAVCVEVASRYGYLAGLKEFSRALSVADGYYLQRYETDDSFWMDENKAVSMWVDFYELLLREVDIDGDARMIAQAIYDEFGKTKRWKLYPDVITTFEKLKSKGIKLGIISNWDGRLPELCLELGLSKYMEFIISSALVGRVKPQPEIFKLGLEKVGIEPANVVHVGDHYYADILGARNAGITPVLISRESDLNIEDSNCLVIKNLFELTKSNLF
ncbi:HAD family hydrolase [Candidatus Oleimmundimicrobium sp.]|uniref:HAD family hydrolase n=1 Tax=Candidatus Oleimmundimicrobium sp. TaxID=3060597 RepID=UPI0027286D87|nr:HAD family hydrolase [Candidatus Oleimmundimicrobium sp.]MDO8885901.1 HAD family hydrolase [Candidatus Oleimmundimicrobium sp.]